MDTNQAVHSFFEAVNNNDVSTVKELLKNKAVQVDVKDQSSENKTALHIAARKGYDNLAQVLVDDFKAPVNVKDDNGQIPLQAATDQCHKSVAQFLVQRNSDLSEYATPLLTETMKSDTDENEAFLQFFKAVKRNNINKVRELLQNRAIDVNFKDVNQKRTALHYAAENGNEDLVRILVDEFNAEVNVKDKKNRIPLQIATDLCHMKITKFLLQRNSDMREYAECMLNDNPLIDELFDAAESNDIMKVTELVKERNVDVNSTDNSRFGRSILHVAAINGHQELVRLLVDELNADTEMEDETGDTPYHVSVDHPEISDFLLQRGYYGDDSGDDDEGEQ